MVGRKTVGAARVGHGLLVRLFAILDLARSLVLAAVLIVVTGPTVALAPSQDRR
jgi:hypothetical protein